MLETTRDYELAYLLDPRLKDEEIFQWQTDFKNFLVNEMDGEFKKEINAKKRKLAYSVKKQTLAYFGSIYFISQPEKINALDKKLKIDNTVLRHLVIQVDKKHKKELIRKEREMMEKILKKPELSASVGKEDKKKVGLEELDKKIEEILTKDEFK